MQANLDDTATTTKGRSLSLVVCNYTKSLVIQMLQTRRSEHVAQGLMRQSPENNGNDDDDTTDILSLFLVSLNLIPRDMATLVFAMLRYVSAATTNRHRNNTSSRHIVNKTRNVCNALFWSSSMEHQEAIIEQLLFSNKASFPGFRNISGSDSGSEGFPQQQQIIEKGQRRWSRLVAEILAPSPASVGKTGGHSGLLLLSFSKHLANIADRWSQWTFVQEVEGRQQHHISLVLWQGLVRLESSESTSSSSWSLRDPGQRKLTAALVNGVSHRLGSTLSVPRQDGMRIAQQLARGLGQDDLQFDEFIPDDDSSIEDNDTLDVADIGDDEETSLTEKKCRNQSKQRSHEFVDPDEDYDSEEENDGEDNNGDVDTVSKSKEKTPQNNDLIGDTFDDSEDDYDDDDVSVEWESELIPYDLEDDEEDLRETPRPLHLLEALDLLRTGDNHDHAYSRHEAALDALQTLIRARPDDLNDVAVSLVLQLLRMEDKFNIENFNSKRETAIRALLVEEPMPVGQTLVEQLFEESGLADRLTIIACLQSAAFELSGNKSLIEALMKKSEKLSSSKRTSLSVDAQEHDESTKYHTEQASRVLSKTRRKRSRGQQRAIRNRFSNIAPMWFYSLIAGFVKHKEDETLWTGSTGSILLTHFLRCLATIVEFSGVQASQVLANDLLDLVWDFRGADVAEVRLSVLVAVSTSIAMLSDEKLIALLFGEANLPKIMHEMSHNDPDKECRSLSRTISFSIHEVLNSEF